MDGPLTATTLVYRQAVASPTSLYKIELSRRDDDDKGGTGQTPFLFFIALAIGIVLVNLWVVLGLRYCCRTRIQRRLAIQDIQAAARRREAENEGDDELAFYLSPLFNQRRATGRMGKKLMSTEELNRRFPVVQYKIWKTEREHAGLSSAGGISEEEVANRIDAASEAAGNDASVNTAAAAAARPPTPPPSPPPLAPRKSIDTIDYNLDEFFVIHENPDDFNDFNDNDDEEDDGESGDMCSVCLDALDPHNQVRGLSCGHVFHEDCITRWLTTRKGSCPLCKAEFIPESEQLERPERAHTHERIEPSSLRGNDNRPQRFGISALTRWFAGPHIDARRQQINRPAATAIRIP